MKFRRLAVATVVASLFASGAALADLTVGITVSATGPASALGAPQKNTVALLPATVGGEKVNWIVLDDATDPTQASKNAKKLADNLGKTFALTGWTAQAVDVVQDSGELNPSVRVVLMADDGTAYDCVSTGIAKALSNLQAVLGEPSSWPEPVKVKAVEEKGRRGFRYTTLVLA